MNSEVLTAPGVQRDEGLLLQATGYWSSSAATRPTLVRGVAPFAVALGLLSALPVTFGKDPWNGTRAERSLTCGATALEPVSCARISLQEARSRAVRILLEAEERRLRAAQQEADRTAGWEEIG